MRFKAVLTGMGFTSQKRASHRGLRATCSSPGGSKVVLQAQFHQPVHLGGDDIGRHGDDAFAAQGADGNGFIIVAGPDVKVRRAETADALHGAPSPRRPP